MKRYGLIKSGLDAHTLGMSNAAQLLEECSFAVFIADPKITGAVDRISEESFFSIFKNWILENKITHLGYSYRLDPGQALETFTKLIFHIDRDSTLSPVRNGCIKEIYYAGLPESCSLIENEFRGRFKTFKGDETPVETLKRMGISSSLIPKTIQQISVYDELRLSFGRELIERERQFTIHPFKEYSYKDYGTPKDHLIKRLDYAKKINRLPLTRVHAGPYLKDREHALALFSEWLRQLSDGGFLDIVSVGSSQLSQSNFGEDWGDMPNGGGVPFNNELELRAIREDASPMLVRAYSATKNIRAIARILEKNLNMAWHALSLWWFNRLDGRGPLDLRECLKEHLEAIRYVAKVGKPYEPNTPHHFAFRGADDVSCIVSSYLAAKTAKKQGIRFLVLQNMLNTPKSTWGLRDLVKSRVMLRLARSLEDSHFRIIYQPRAGLDFFSSDPDRAKYQLASVSALMDDVEPQNKESPEIIHVVSYSEALFLANPEVIKESLRITKASLKFYPDFRKTNFLFDLIIGKDVKEQTEELWEEARTVIENMEKNIPNLYTSEGFFEVFKQGYFPVPYLWECREDFPRAVNWITKTIKGGVQIIDDTGKKMSVSDRLRRIRDLNANDVAA